MVEELADSDFWTDVGAVFVGFFTGVATHSVFEESGPDLSERDTLLCERLVFVVARVDLVRHAVLDDEPVPAGVVFPQPQLAVVVEQSGDFDDLGGGDAHLGVVGFQVDVDRDVARRIGAHADRPVSTVRFAGGRREPVGLQFDSGFRGGSAEF